MTKQKPHKRTSKKGKIFQAGRGGTKITLTNPKMLPIVNLEGDEGTTGFKKGKYFFDKRLRQIRDINDPFIYYDLDAFEVDYFDDLSKGIGVSGAIGVKRKGKWKTLRAKKVK